LFAVSLPERRISLSTLVALVALSAYAGSLRGGFVWDDVGNVVHNVWITGPAHLGAIFTSHVAGFDRELSTAFYRPGMHVVLMATRGVFGMRPWGFHLVNVLLHAACSVWVVLIARVWLDRGAVVAGLVFAVHPVHVESVAWISGITDLSSACFGLGALWLWLRGRDVAGAASFFFALLCKEVAIAVPALIVLVEPRRVKRWIPYAIAGASYLALRWNALGGIAPARRTWNLDPIAYGASALALFSGYVGKLLLPVGLNPAHPFHPARSLADPRAVAGLLLAALLAAAIVACRREQAVVVGGALFAISLLPTLYLPALGETPFAERYLYLPSAGFAVLVGFAWEAAYRRREQLRAVLVVVTVLILGACWIATVRRAEDWRDELTLWTDAAAKAPGSVVAQQNLADALRESGHLDAAIDRYRRALALEPARADALNNLGVAYQAGGRADLAEGAYRAAMASSPGHASAHANLGLILIDAGRFDEGTAECEAALRIDPDHAAAHHNLGIAYARQGRMDRAIPELEAAVRLRPDVSTYRDNLERARSAR
jgi:tetratricopeptide (TPR) repeat protein